MVQTLTPVLPQSVTFTRGFWADRVQVNRRVTIPYLYRAMKNSGRIDAFRLRWKPGQPNRPHYFWDSDVAKWMEAASYSLAAHPDRRLQRQLDDLISLLAAAQQPDGYLNVYFSVVEPTRRWTNLRDWHELYCAGHLIEAAVAHFGSTGKRTLLDTLLRYADHIDARFPPGKTGGYPGHEQIELALVRLARATGDERYLHLAKRFIDWRGQRPHFFDAEARARGENPKDWEWTYEKNQSHLPVRRQREAVGHAVRAMYLYCGMADVAAATGDRALLTACRRLWRSVTGRKMYITGGIGSVRRGEALGPDYHLPSESAYCETCAAIGLVLFAHRMIQIDRDARYADVMERALYNGVISGVSLDGKRFFYENPLASGGLHHRKPWFECACCPPNLARLLASLGSYAYSTAPRALYVHLFVAADANMQLAHVRVRLRQVTDYPWTGVIEIRVDPDTPAAFDLFMRIPAWCPRHELRINGRKVDAAIRRGYAGVRRRWCSGDRLKLVLSMPVERIQAHPRVADAAGRVALQRGPIVYCFEQCDHRCDIRLLRLPGRTRIQAVRVETLGGVVVLRAGARVISDATRGLYAAEGVSRSISIVGVPYCLWDNRRPGAMLVWLPRAANAGLSHGGMIGTGR